MGYKAHQWFCKAIITVCLILLAAIFVTALAACEPITDSPQERLIEASISQDEKLARLDARLMEVEFKHSQLIMDLCMTNMREELLHHCKDFP